MAAAPPPAAATAASSPGLCPSYAVVCSFLERYGALLDLPELTFPQLERYLQDTASVPKLLVDLHVKLLRKIGKSVSADRWEKHIIKICSEFNTTWAWELEQKGYKDMAVECKIGILKYLCECQFDDNVKFKNTINEDDPDKSRQQPIGRDKDGQMYWFQLDQDNNVRVYVEEQDDLSGLSWKCIVRDRNDLAEILALLKTQIDPAMFAKKEKEEGSSPKSEDAENIKNGEEVVVKKTETDEEGKSSKDAACPVSPKTESNENLPPKDEVRSDAACPVSPKTESNENLPPKDEVRSDLIEAKSPVNGIKDEKDELDPGVQSEKPPVDNNGVSFVQTIKEEPMELSESTASTAKIEALPNSEKSCASLKTDQAEDAKKNAAEELQRAMNDQQAKIPLKKRGMKLSEGFDKSGGSRIIVQNPSVSQVREPPKIEQRTEEKKNEHNVADYINGDDQHATEKGVPRTHLFGSNTDTEKHRNSADDKRQPAKIISDESKAAETSQKEIPATSNEGIKNQTIQGGRNTQKSMESETSHEAEKKVLAKKVERENTVVSGGKESSIKSAESPSHVVAAEPPTPPKDAMNALLASNHKEAEKNKCKTTDTTVACTADGPPAIKEINKSKSDFSDNMVSNQEMDSSVASKQPKLKSYEKSANKVAPADMAISEKNKPGKPNITEITEKVADPKGQKWETGPKNPDSPALTVMSGVIKKTDTLPSDRDNTHMSNDPKEMVGHPSVIKKTEVIKRSNDTGSLVSPIDTKESSVIRKEDKHSERLENTQQMEGSSVIKKAEKADAPKQAEKTHACKQAEKADAPKQAEKEDGPKQAGKTDAPKQAEKTESPKQAEKADTPKRAEKTDAPKQVEKADAPKQAVKTDVPKRAEKTHACKQTEKTDAPKQAEKIDASKQAVKTHARKQTDKTDALKQAEKTDTPKQAEKADTLKRAEKTNASKQAEKSDAPKLAEKTDAPKQAEKAEAPKQAEKTDAPKQAEKVDAPKQAEKTDAPKREEKAEAPKRAEKTHAPKQAEKADASKQAEKDDAPKQAEKANAPKRAEKKEAPKQAEKTDTPKRAEKTDAPKQADKTDAPNQADKIDAPKQTRKMDAPKRTEKNDAHKQAEKSDSLQDVAMSEPKEEKTVAAETASEMIRTEEKERLLHKKVPITVLSQDKEIATVSMEVEVRKENQSEPKCDKVKAKTTTVKKVEEPAEEKGKTSCSVETKHISVNKEPETSSALPKEDGEDKHNENVKGSDKESPKNKSKNHPCKDKESERDSKTKDHTHMDDEKETQENNDGETSNEIEKPESCTKVRKEPVDDDLKDKEGEDESEEESSGAEKKERVTHVSSKVRKEGVRPKSKVSTSRTKAELLREERQEDSESDTNVGRSLRRSARISRPSIKAVEIQDRRLEKLQATPPTEKHDEDVGDKDSEEEDKDDGVKAVQKKPRERNVDQESQSRSKGRKRKKVRWTRARRKKKGSGDDDDDDSGDFSSEDWETEEEDDSDESFKVEKSRRRRNQNRERRSDASETSSDDDLPPNDDPCKHCGLPNHPELILLCDSCDSGYHTACLRPPLMIIPDGEWFCQLCQHKQLCDKLEEQLQNLDAALKKKERADRRKERLVYVGISVENIITPSVEVEDEKEKVIVKKKEIKRKTWGRRSTRVKKNISYRFDEFDEAIEEAIEEDIKEAEGGGAGRGKDMANITGHNRGKDINVILNAEEGTENGGPPKPAAGPRRKKRRRLNDLDSDSTVDDDESEDEFRLTESSDEDEFVASDNAESASDGSNDSGSAGGGRRRSSRAKRQPKRRKSARRRRKGYSDDEEEETDEDDEEEFVTEGSSEFSDSDLDMSRRRSRRSLKKEVNYCETSESEGSNRNKYKPRRRPGSSESEASSSKDSEDEPREPRTKRRRVDSSEEETRQRRMRASLKRRRASEEEDDSSSSDESEEEDRPVRKRVNRIDSDDDDDEEEEEEKGKKGVVEKDEEEGAVLGKGTSPLDYNLGELPPTNGQSPIKSLEGFINRPGAGASGLITNLEPKNASATTPAAAIAPNGLVSQEMAPQDDDEDDLLGVTDLVAFVCSNEQL